MLTCAGTPQLPFKRPQIPSNRDHKALNRGTLGGAGGKNARPGIYMGSSTGIETSNTPVSEGPSTQYLRTLVPKAIKGMVLGPESLNIGYHR